MRKALFFFVFLFVLPLGFACETTFDTYKNVTIFDTIIPQGAGASCTISLYNSTDLLVSNASMQQDGLKYNYEAGSLDVAAYRAPIVCEQTSGNDTILYFSECSFEVEEETLNPVYLLYILAFVFLLIGLWARTAMWYSVSAVLFFLSGAGTMSTNGTLATVLIVVGVGVLGLAYSEFKR